jgi:hypothetical protein
VLRQSDQLDVQCGCKWLQDQNDIFTDDYYMHEPGWQLSNKDKCTFWILKAIEASGCSFDYTALERAGWVIDRKVYCNRGEVDANTVTKIITWSTDLRWLKLPGEIGEAPLWWTMDDSCVSNLAHELQHAADAVYNYRGTLPAWEDRARTTQNSVNKWMIGLHESWYNVPDLYSYKDYMRPMWRQQYPDFPPVRPPR